MSAPPSVALGLPAYNGARFIDEAVRSLRDQSYENFVLVCCDDASDDGTAEVLARHAAEDPRVVVRRSDSRLGLIENWRRTFAMARESAPDARYFAWASDHDVWHPEWLERLVEHLERHPEAVLAYPLNVGIDDHGAAVRESWRFDTAGIGDTWRRLETSVRDIVPGSMVYGLYRADSLARCGVYRRVLVPDRLLLSELALYGEFHQIPELLWSRRYREGTKVSARRQRAAFFPGGAPVHAYLPWPLTHSVAIAWDLVIRGAGRPRHGRLVGVTISLWYLGRASALAIYRRVRTIGHRVKKRLHAV